MSERRYFTEHDARDLVGMRVKPRVAIIRLGPKTRLIIRSSDRGTVTRFAPGSYSDGYLIGVAWDDQRRHNRHPIDWYTERECRDLLEVSASNEASSPIARARLYQVGPFG